MSIQVQHRRDSNTNIEGVTPAVGELGYDTTKKEALMGDGATAGGVRLAKKNIGEILVAAQLSANTNDYNPTGLKHARKLIISTDASRDITGLVPSSPGDTTDGREITIYNGGSFNATLKDQNASSSAANRFDLGGADVVLSPKASVTLRYRTSGSLNRWEMDASTAGAAVASGAVIARTIAGSAMGLRSGMINGKIVPSNNGTVATYALKTLAGNDPSASDPVLFVFQDGTGQPVVISQQAAASWGFSSGSSAGATSGAPFIIHHVAINNAGSLLFGAVNCRNGNSIMSLAEDSTYSTTAEGGAGAADNAQVIYASSAVSGKYICYLGRSNYESGLTTAGTWNANPTNTVVWSPGMARPGEIISTSYTETGASATDTAANFPSTDTVPTSSQGSQFMSLTTEASHSKANLFEVDVQANIIVSAACFYGLALFQDAGASAVASCFSNIINAGGGMTPLHKRLVSGVAAGTQTTFKVRGGMDRAGTTTFNGSGGTRAHGGVIASSIIAREIQG